ncbi:two-component response regulator 24-like [Lycium barbarum]|uniref:two-component response regulator 24-like n=1 Tax=Lycium barbarum TaxID=112863 RepID=UPI00293F48ED|nr:two-component response regulator 24-like [Lycium barbarum]
MSSSYDVASSMSKRIDNPNIEKKMKALIVDDDPVVRMVHKALLRKFGAETHEVKNGQEAVFAHRSGECFDLILMDLDMPVMDGRQATKELRDMHVVSLIAGVTSLGEAEKKSFMDAGLDYYYQKPLTIDAVRYLVEKIKNDA